MAPALMLILDTGDASNSLRVMLKRVEADQVMLRRYWDEFDPMPPQGQPSRTTTTYLDAERQLTSLKRLLRKLSLEYSQESRRSFAVVLRDKALRASWKELCNEIDGALEAMDRIGEENYTRARVWLVLKPILLAYPDLVQELQAKLGQEPR